VNDAPVTDLNGAPAGTDNTADFTEQTAVLIAPSATILDVDSANLTSLTAVNDAPTATNLSAPETYTEDTPLNLTDIVVSDVDSTDVTVTLTLSNTAAGA
jgi:hypothetical protein